MISITATFSAFSKEFSRNQKSIFTAAMLGPQCLENPPEISSTSGEGKVEEFAGLKTYITGKHDSNRAILLISDAFGYEAPNLRKLADKVADAGYLVAVPDFFYGDPINPNFDKDPNFDVERWKNVHNPEKGCEDAKTVVSALKKLGVSAIGAAGFCWGGMVLVKLGKFDSIQAGVILHPGPITANEINEVTIPVALLGAEIDKYFPVEKFKHIGGILSAKPEVDSLVKVFPGVRHGWTLRYNSDDESEVKFAEEAHSDMLRWLNKHVK